MIVSIESSIQTFKAIRFHTGLNVLLADTQPGASEKQTRNSAGKTSVIEIVHFLLGANADKDSLFRTKALIQHTFTGTFMLSGEEFVVSRSGAEPSKIWLWRGGENRADLPRKIDKATNRPFISNANWRTFLGHVMFGMPADVEGTSFDRPGAPSFRALFPYFARRRSSGAFQYPERHNEQQQRGDWQINLSYLVGLDWEIPFELQQVRLRERTLDELRRAAKLGAFGQLVGSAAELRPQVTIAETKATRLRAALAEFEVLDSYRDLSREAGRAKTEMQALSRDLVSLYETLDHLERALAAETPPEAVDLQNIYAAAGIELPGMALRRFEEVKEFHKSVIQNRRKHLAQEIAETNEKITDAERSLSRLDAKRRNILKTLEGRGALEDFLRLQRELAEAEAAAASLRERFKAAEMLEGQTTQLELDRINLKRRLQADHQERKALLDEAILAIADIISELYDDRTGRFVVEATDNGPEFRISIEGDRGGGIANMEIFCFDLALLQLVTKRLGGPRFLIHDSHLFDGVDVRQIARALLLGQSATAAGLQYIVTMNSDIFDSLPLAKELNRDQIVLKTRLSDETEIGGLFGFRFD
jgi:uncharacterized protein YydD (DUF2326 family)